MQFIPLANHLGHCEDHLLFFFFLTLFISKESDALDSEPIQRSKARHVCLGIPTAAAAAAVHWVQSRIRTLQARDNGAIALSFDITNVMSDDVGRATLRLASHIFFVFFVFPKHKSAPRLLVSNGRRLAATAVFGVWALRPRQRAVCTNIARRDALFSVTPDERTDEVEEAENKGQNTCSKHQ